MADGTSSAAFTTSFIHFGERMSSETSRCRRSKDLRNALGAGVSGRSMPPSANQDALGGMWRSTIPASHMADEISMTAPSVRSGPMTSAMVVDGHAVLQSHDQAVRGALRIDQLDCPTGVVGLHDHEDQVERVRSVATSQR